MFTKNFNFLKVTLLALGLGACGMGEEQSFDEFNTLSDTDMWLGSDERVRPPLFEDSYVIGEKDEIEIDVRDHDEFDIDVTVDNDGEIRLPLVPEPLLVRGLTLEQAEETISNFIGPLLHGEIHCDVRLLTSGSKFYYVMGSGVTGVKSIGSNSDTGGGGAAFGSGSIRKIPMPAEAIFLRDLLLEHEDETQMDDIGILRPDFTDRKRPRFMRIDMSGIERGHWNVNYRIRPNDIIIVRKTFKERVFDVIDDFVSDVDKVRQRDSQIEATLRFIEARVHKDTARKNKHSSGR